MDRLRVGLWLLPAAALCWILLADGGTDLLMPLLAAGVGWAAAAWAAPSWRRAVGALGFLAAAAGVAWSYGFVLWDGLPAIAGLAVAAACVACAAACAGAWPRALAAGLTLLAAGALLWVVADGTGDWTRQPGDLLALAGAGLAASEAWPRALA
jgi:hypothetical protein